MFKLENHKKIFARILRWYEIPFQKWLPNNDSAILVDNFKSAKQLADRIMFLNANDREYVKHLRHKTGQKIENQGLIDALQHRSYETNSIVEDFECFVCQRSVEGGLPKEPVARNGQYDGCNEHLVIPRMLKSHESADWSQVIRQGKCEAALLREFVDRNQTFNQKDYQSALIQKYEQGACEIW